MKLRTLDAGAPACGRGLVGAGAITHSDRPKAKASIREANASLILQAAERVFARRGFPGATMAEIAEQAGLPKANVHYYFGSKKALYRALLDQTLRDWLAPLQSMQPDADPRTAIETYVREKMRLVQARPDASRVFANELLHGAPEIKEVLRTSLRELVQSKASVIEGWVQQGLMAPVDATHLFFTIWAATQTYADFDVQVRSVLGRSRLTRADHERATQHVVEFVLRGCGLLGEPGVTAGQTRVRPGRSRRSH